MKLHFSGVGSGAGTSKEAFITLRRGKRNVASIYAWAKPVTDVTLDFSSSLHEYDSRVRAPDIFQYPCLQLCLHLGTTLSLCCHLGPLTLSRSL